MNSNTSSLDDITKISQKRTAINAVTNYAQYAVSIVVGILLQRYLILSLGKDEYAIWPLIFTCMSLVTLIPIGIGSGVARFMAHALGRNDVKEIERITTSLFAALLAGTVVYTICVIFISVNFEKIFDIPAGAEGIGPWAMFLSGLSGAVALPFGVFQGGLRAAQKFTVLNFIKIISLILQILLVTVVFSFGLKSLIWVAAINLVLETAGYIVIYIAAKKIVPWQKIKWRSLDWQTLKKVNSFSLLVLISAVAELLYWKTDNVIINKLLLPSLLTGYAVVANFILYTFRITSVSLDVLNPVATIMHAKNQYSRIADMIYRVNRNITPVTVCILFFLIAFGREILLVYLGSGYDDFAILFPILGTGAIISVLQSLSNVVPQAFGRMKEVSFVALAAALLNVLLSIFFVVVWKWGLIGVAAGTAIVTVINKSVFWPWYSARLLKVSWSTYFYKSFLFPLFNCIPFAIVTLVLKWMGFGNSLMGLAVVFCISGFVELAFMLICGLDFNDRNKIKKLFYSFFKIPSVT